jgi:hypothetical protein
VNRGYFVESGAVPEATVPEMDTQLRAAFPDLTDKPFYPSTSVPTPEAVATFADWLISATSGRLLSAVVGPGTIP